MFGDDFVSGLSFVEVAPAVAELKETAGVLSLVANQQGMFMLQAGAIEDADVTGHLHLHVE